MTLRVKNLTVRRSRSPRFAAGAPRTFRALADVSLELSDGDSLALVGESGSGKTTLLRCVAGLERPQGGSVSLDGRPVSHHRRRGEAGVGFVSQEPGASFDPTLPIWRSVAEPLRVRGHGDRAERRSRALAALAGVGLGGDEAVRRPSGLSGGELQRAAIARALIATPRLLLADEPLAAVDASVRARLIALLAEGQRAAGAALLLASHDLAAAARLARRVAVLHAGRIVELGPCSDIFAAPAHPYTAALLAARPRIDAAGPAVSPSVLPPILDDGEAELDGVGCRWASVCPRAGARCSQETPGLEPLDAADERRAACWNPPGASTRRDS